VTAPGEAPPVGSADAVEHCAPAAALLHRPATTPRAAAVMRWSWPRIVAGAVAMLVLGFGLGYATDAYTGRPGTVDVGFCQDMIDHHDQATYMARLAIANPTTDPAVRRFADEVVLAQRWEIGIMDTLLAGWGHGRGDPDRRAMGWMAMPTAVATMPGMQSDEALTTLRTATGRDADRLFLTMMSEHHQGGIHMAEFAAERARDPRVRDLAARFARNQTVETREYAALATRLGIG